MRHIVWFGGLLNAVQLVKRRPFSPTLQKHARAIMQQFLKMLKMIIFEMKNCDIFLIFAQNIDRTYTLDHRLIEAVLTSNNNLCFGTKIRLICIPL